MHVCGPESSEWWWLFAFQTLSQAVLQDAAEHGPLSGVTFTADLCHSQLGLKSSGTACRRTDTLFSACMMGMQVRKHAAEQLYVALLAIDPSQPAFAEVSV